MQNKSVYVSEIPTAAKRRRHSSMSGNVVLVDFSRRWNLLQCSHSMCQGGVVIALVGIPNEIARSKPYQPQEGYMYLEIENDFQLPSIDLPMPTLCCRKFDVLFSVCSGTCAGKKFGSIVTPLVSTSPLG